MLALLRGLHLVALLAAFGTLVFAELVAPLRVRSRLVRHARFAASAALLAGAAWLAVQAAAFADTWDLGFAVPAALLFSRFGHVLGLRLLLIAAVVLFTFTPRMGRWIPPVLAGAALAMQGAMGHAGATEGNAAPGLMAAEALHLLAAGAWFGSLLPLLLCLWSLPPHEGRLAAEGFSPIGMTAVVLIAATAFAQSVSLIGGFPALIGTDYGRAALLKLALFGLMLVLAVWNRLSLTDRLDAGNSARTHRLLIVSVATEAICGVLAILTAGFLASLVPGVHEQPIWPFAWRPSLTVLEDSDLRHEVAFGVLALGASLGIVTVSWMARRFRIPALLAAIVLTIWQVPSLKLLSIEAYPTSYQTSPTGFSAASIQRGRNVFAANCASCHGAGGQADGPDSTQLQIKPADLTAGHLWDHRDGDLFWWVGHGIEAPDGGLAMPGFAGLLSDSDRWAAIDFIHSLNAGASMQLSGTWTHPVPAPDLPIACAWAQAASCASSRQT
jgi:putative copper export protein/mono/diheme cytochrome c family protein